MEITAELVPAWLVAISWIYTGFIWIVTRKDEIRMDSTIWGMTFVFAGLLYLLTYIPYESTADEVSRLGFRILSTRVLMLLLALSQWLPLTISHLRALRRNIWKV